MWWKHCHKRIVQIRVDLDRIGIKLVEKELLPLSEHLSSSPILIGVRVTRSLVLCVCFVDRLSYFYWPLCCLFFFDIRILITPLISSNSSSYPKHPRVKCMELWSTIMGLHVRHALCCSKQINEGVIGMRVWKYTFCISNRFIEVVYIHVCIEPLTKLIVSILKRGTNIFLLRIDNYMTNFKARRRRE